MSTRQGNVTGNNSLGCKQDINSYKNKIKETSLIFFVLRCICFLTHWVSYYSSRDSFSYFLYFISLLQSIRALTFLYLSLIIRGYTLHSAILPITIIYKIWTLHAIPLHSGSIPELKREGNTNKNKSSYKKLCGQQYLLNYY